MQFVHADNEDYDQTVRMRAHMSEGTFAQVTAQIITVEFRWLEPLWDLENLFETAVVRTSEGYY